MKAFFVYQIVESNIFLQPTIPIPISISSGNSATYKVFLYIGQAVDLCERIRTHNEGPARARNNFTASIVGGPLQLQNIGPVDRALILKQLISKCFQTIYQFVWAECAKDTFDDIKNSANAILRQYYQNLLFKRRVPGQQARQKKGQSMNIIRYFEPTNTTVKASHEGEIHEIVCGSFRFTISQLLGLWARNVFK